MIKEDCIEAAEDSWWPVAALGALMGGLGVGYRRCSFGVIVDAEDLRSKPLDAVRLLATTREGSLLGFPGGKQEPWDECSLSALKRETQEETGLALSEGCPLKMGTIVMGRQYECEVYFMAMEGLKEWENRELKGVEPHVRGLVLPWGSFKGKTFESNKALESVLLQIQAVVAGMGS